MNEMNETIMNEEMVNEIIDDPCDPNEHNWMVLAIGTGLAALIGAGVTCHKKIRAVYLNRLRKRGYTIVEPLSAKELWKNVAEYCYNDVIATEAVFNRLKADPETESTSEEAESEE